MIRTIAKRYATALMQLAEGKNILDKTKDDLTAFVETVDASPELQKLFASPVFTPDHKKSVIDALAKKLKLQQTSCRFLAYLAESGRIRYVKDVQEAFLALLAERQNRAIARLTTASPLSAKDLAAIKKTLEELTGKQVDVIVQEDASLIGGLKAQIGSVVYDGSIKNQIDAMRIKLMNS